MANQKGKSGNYQKDRKAAYGGKKDGSRDFEQRGSRNSRNQRGENSAASNGRGDSRTKSTEMSTNHIEWYVPDANMLNNVANIPFNYRTGSALKFTTGAVDQSTTEAFVMPGVTRITYMPTIGTALTAGDPVNTASNAVYSFIRHANSGSRNYDAPDLMMYLMAMDSIYTGISFLQRVQSLAFNFDRENLYTPRVIYRAMGIDYEDLRGSLNELNTRLNTMIMKAGNLCVPRAFSLYERHAYMVSNIYCDEPNARSQFYFFQPDFLYKWTISDEGWGELSPVKFYSPDGVETWRFFADIVDELLDAIYDEEDIGLMSGDILKAYGQESIFRLATVPQLIVNVPVYDEGMLNQIHNATPMGYYDEAPKITQVLAEGSNNIKAYLYCRPMFARSYAANLQVVGGDKLLDLHCDITAENIMRSTRLMVGTVHADEEDARLIWAESLPSEVVLYTTHYRITNDDVSATQYFGSIDLTMNDGEGLTLAKLRLITDAQSQAFYPILYVYTGESSDSILPVASFDKTTVINADNIDKLNEVALLGLFNVPRLTVGTVAH